MEALLVILYTVVFIIIIHKINFFDINGISKTALSMIFVLKILVGIGLGLIYTYYYKDRTTADIYKYFDDSKVMFDAIFNKPMDYFQMLLGIHNDTPNFDIYYHKMNFWTRQFESNLYNDSHTIIRFNAFLRIFSFGYYYVHTVFMCFISFIGLTAIYKTFEPYMKMKYKELMFAVFLIPSVLFWGSGVLKEGLLLFGLGLLIYNYFKLLNKQYNIVVILIIAFSIFLLIHLKFYIMVALAPALLASFIVTITSNKYIILKYLFSIIIIIIIGLNIYRVFPEYDAMKIIYMKQHDFINLAKYMESGSMIEISKLEPNPISLIKTIPQALFNTFLRPLPHDINTSFKALAFLENILILLILIISILFIKLKEINHNMLLFAITFVMLLFITIGITTPVIGAIVRYKIPALPFLLIFLFMMIDKEKLLNKFPFLKRMI